RQWTRSTKQLPRDQDGMGSTLVTGYKTRMPCGKHSSRHARLFAWQLAEPLASNWLESLNAHALAWRAECVIANSKIRLLAMPALEAGPEVDGTAWFRTDGILPFRLIPASASSAQQELITCPLFAMFDVPVIAASQFSDDLGDGDGASGNRCSAAL